MEKLQNWETVFAERLAKARKKNNLGVRELARIANVSYSLVSAIETERTSNVRVFNAIQIAMALNTTVEHLLGLDEYLDKVTNKDTIPNSGDISAFEKMILATYKFPNGMTYIEMEERLKEMEKAKEMLDKMADIIEESKNEHSDI